MKTTKARRAAMLPRVFILLAATCAAAACHSTTAFAASCNDSAGKVVWKNTIYGGLTGGLLTGLALISMDDGDKADRKLATGALVGGGIGVVAGAVELLGRDCDDRAGSSKSRALYAESRSFSTVPVEASSHSWLSLGFNSVQINFSRSFY